MDDLLPAGLPDPVHDARILPGIDERAVNRLLVGKDVLKRFEEVAPCRSRTVVKSVGTSKTFRRFARPTTLLMIVCVS